MASTTMELSPVQGPFFRRAVRSTLRMLREVFGATLILAIWGALWLWAISAVLQPWSPARDQVERRAAAPVERAY